jgi:hypothetical protein
MFLDQLVVWDDLENTAIGSFTDQRIATGQMVCAAEERDCKSVRC